MNDQVIKYVYRFYLGEKEAVFPIEIDPATLLIIKDSKKDYPAWAKLNYCQCKSCPLKDQEYCPLACTLASSVAAFKNALSTESIEVKVSSNDRVYYKSLDLQHGFSSMLGLMMPISGCPHFKFFRPMARFHLPFSSLEETIYRVVSSFLLGQYFEKKGESCFDLVPLVKIYENLQQVNADFVERLRSAVNRDGGLNAVVILDTFAQLLPFSLQDELEELAYLYRT